jgi:hypothetical protein
MVFRREGTYAIVAILVTLVVAATLFVYPAWSQDGERKTERQTEKKVEKKNEKRNQKNTGTERNSTRTVDSLSRVAAQDPSFQQALQGSAENDGSGDLVGNDVEVEPDDPEDPEDPIERIDVFGDDCEVDADDAFIVFEVVDEDSPDEGEFGIVADGDNVQIIERSDRIVIEAIDENEDIEFFTFEGEPTVLSGDLEVRSSFGIECDNDNNNNRRDRDRDRDERFRERVNQVLEEEGLVDEDGDGDIDQEDEFLDAQNDLDDDGEITDGEFTDADTFDDGDLDDGPVSATAEDGRAEASTPGAVARSGGDPDELEPLRSAPDDVVNEIPTSGPLPNTGGMPMFYWLLPLAGLLMLAGLPVYRWIKSRG